MNGSGEVVSVNESGFSKVLTDEALKAQMALAVRIEERYGNRTDEDTPSNQYVEGVLNLESLGFTPLELKNDYKKPVTRIELAETLLH